MNISSGRMSLERNKSAMVNVALWAGIVGILLSLLMILFFSISAKYDLSDDSVLVIFFIFILLVSLCLTVSFAMSLAGVITPYFRLKSFFVLIMSTLIITVDFALFLLALTENMTG
ncbi:hypothetical protein EB837_10025 [Kluyvera ascorbata]|uniref:Uncharacterized protein n=1 Tax=Kluyvera ascorbata TaxID=51288 RepID=A0A3N2S597_9ENTR|nr:hypothetical protein [Kluyvera ascorbata]MDZ4031778.1 hypothetical protein [Kluyvera ascorbata]ROU14798.1 hypothetical protein EB837_10025 [Kluyvera ascorbata]